MVKRKDSLEWVKNTGSRGSIYAVLPLLDTGSTTYAWHDVRPALEGGTHRARVAVQKGRQIQSSLKWRHNILPGLRAAPGRGEARAADCS